jgi:hypothetical protein
VIWPWQRTRRARATELAALGASVGDERLDPARILGAATGEYQSLAGARNGEDVGELEARFGAAPVSTLMRLRPPVRGATNAVIAQPSEVTLWLGKRPEAVVVDFRLSADGARAEAALQLSARARSWVGERGYAFARYLNLGQIGSGNSQYPAASARRLHALWVFELTDTWRFVRFESRSSAAYRYERPLDTAEDHHREIRDGLVLRDAADDKEGLKIPREIAESLPFDARPALLELSGLDESFQLYVIEAALRRILALWAQASEGKPGLLDTAASEAAARKLLDPPGTVLRGPELLEVKPVRVRAIRVPPEITVRLDFRAYLGPADPEHELDAGITRTHRFWWRLARQDSTELPWMLLDPDVDPFRA